MVCNNDVSILYRFWNSKRTFEIRSRGVIENGTIRIDTSYTTSCQSVTVNIALSCTMFELLQVEKYRDLET